MEYSDFLILAKKKHNNKFIYNDETEKMFNGSHSIIPVFCPIHGRFEVIAKNHLKYDCEKCSYISRGLKFRSNKEEFVKKGEIIHNCKYDYSESEYIDAKTPITIICPIHGRFPQTPNDHLSGKGCPKCKDSHLETKLCKHLEDTNIVFEEHKHFDWLGKQEIDFYIEKYKIGIECQGKQHIGLGGWKANYDFEKLLKLDYKKQILCNKNDIKLYYYIDKIYYKKALKFEIYNENNLFFDFSDLLRKINEQPK